MKGWQKGAAAAAAAAILVLLVRRRWMLFFAAGALAAGSPHRQADLVFLIPGEIDGDGLTVIGEVGPICEQVLALGPGQEALQDPAFQAALGRAVADLFADEDGRQLLQRLGVEQPLMAADALDLDALRAAAQGREDAA